MRHSWFWTNIHIILYEAIFTNIIAIRWSWQSTRQEWFAWGHVCPLILLWPSIGIQTICNIFFFLIWCRSYLQKVSSEHEFTGNRLSDSHTLCKGVNEFLLVFSSCLDWFWVNFDMEALYALPPSIFEFYENGRVKVLVCFGP